MPYMVWSSVDRYGQSGDSGDEVEVRNCCRVDRAAQY